MKHLAGLGDAVLHPPGARGLELAVLDVGLDAGNRRFAQSLGHSVTQMGRTLSIKGLSAATLNNGKIMES